MCTYTVIAICLGRQRSLFHIFIVIRTHVSRNKEKSNNVEKKGILGY
jgi:hypothetical protein